MEEAGIDYKAVRVDLRKGEHLSGPYLALNPVGKVPALVERGGDAPFYLAQSNAIMLYASSLSPGLIMPIGNGHAWALALERYLYFVTDVIAPSFDSFVIGGVNNRGAAVLTQRSLDAFGAAEMFVSRTRFMAGNTFTLADISAVTVGLALQRHIDWQTHPNLARWFEEVAARPGVERGMRAFG